MKTELFLHPVIMFLFAVSGGTVICATIAIDVFAAERVAVKNNVANIRALPNSQSDTLWQVEKFHPFLVMEKKGRWYRIKDFEGDLGWIHNSMVDSILTVVVKVALANVRTGPGTDHDLAGDASKGTPFKFLEEKERWLRVQHNDGDTGWISKSLVW